MTVWYLYKPINKLIHHCLEEEPKSQLPNTLPCTVICHITVVVTCIYLHHQPLFASAGQPHLGANSVPMQSCSITSPLSTLVFSFCHQCTVQSSGEYGCLGDQPSPSSPFSTNGKLVEFRKFAFQSLHVQYPKHIA